MAPPLRNTQIREKHTSILTKLDQSCGGPLPTMLHACNPHPMRVTHTPCPTAHDAKSQNDRCSTRQQPLQRLTVRLATVEVFRRKIESF
jgi:hypothetical protein